MKEIIFKGKIRDGRGNFSKMKIPGRSSLPIAPNDWPEVICPGSLNVKVMEYPEELESLGPGNHIQKLDNGLFQPAFVIPHDRIIGNTIRPILHAPENGNAQVWRAKLAVAQTGIQFPCWVLRRIGSGVAKQLEIVSEDHLRSKYGLGNGDKVFVSLIAGDGD